jgi:hypothetical protein
VGSPGDFKQSEYGKVILPFVVLRRLDCILDSSKAAVLDMAASLPADMDDEARDTVLSGVVGENIKLYNLSRFTFESLKGQDAKDIHKNLIDYITKFSPNVRDIFLEKFLFTDQLKRLNDAGLLYLVFDRFTQIDLHPDAISNLEMGYLFEDLIRRFSEISNETAGEHYTPRGKYLIGQQGGGLGHAAGATTGAEPALLAGKRYKSFEMTFVTAYPEKAVLEAAALQVGLEFPWTWSGRDLPCWASWDHEAG